MSTWEITFNQLIDALLPQLVDGESVTVSLVAEISEFTRFNHGKVRQTGSIENGSLSVTLMANDRSATESITFTGEKAADWPLLMAALATLRAELPQLPEDPYIVLPAGDAHSREVYDGDLLALDAIAPTLLAPMAGLDAVGLYAGGRSVRAYADSAGQRHWFDTATFTLDYSLFTAAGQAVKGTYAGRTWDDAAYADTLAASKTLLAQMSQTPKKLERGQYRTYFAPAAVADLMSMLSWGGIGEASIRRGGSALGPLQRGDKTLSPKVHLTEDFAQGQVPRFNQYGELAPLTLSLIEAGQLQNTLVSARTAKEYGIPSTFAEGGEYLRSPTLAPGNLAESDILAALDTGLYVSNLHYLNWSDRPNGRITGMTRYACFWVENGKIIAPIENLRFDESLYNFWGENLIDLTQAMQLIPEVGSYGFRDLGGTLVPGMLVQDFAYTL
ncbi:MAG: TldD/PmbA family protein [Leptolyngbya sp. SIOISBB]|nr:TldD/PmbA family protein [Leptolyngbya sp. SIOISBB]